MEPRSVGDRHFKGKIFFVILCILLGVVLVEFLSFIIYSRIPRVSNYYQELQNIEPFVSRATYVLHPYFGFSRDPAVCTSGECNKLGFIGAELPTQKSQDTITIGIFGGSVAGKLCAYNSQVFSDKLRQYPFFKNKKIQFSCIALGGFKQPQQLLALSYFFSLGYKFDIVINIDGFNEICLPLAENIPAHVAYSYPRLWNMHLTQNLDTIASEQIERLEQIRRSKADLQRLASCGIFARSYFLKIIQITLERMEIKKHFHLYQYLLKKIEKKELGEYQLYGPKEGYKDNSEMIKKSIALWKDSSRQMAYLCNANAVPYFHFLQPNQYFAGTKKLSPHELQIAYSYSNPYKNAVEQGYPLLVEEGKGLLEEGVNFFDLTTIFKNETRDIYADDCCHVNGLGNEILMDIIAKSVAQYFEKK